MFEKLYRKAVINGHFLDDRVFDNILLKIVFEATQTNHMYLEQIYSIIYPNSVSVAGLSCMQLRSQQSKETDGTE